MKLQGFHSESGSKNTQNTLITMKNAASLAIKNCVIGHFWAADVTDRKSSDI